MGNRDNTPFWSSGAATSNDEADPSKQHSRSWRDLLFPSRVERALLLALYLVGAFYLVFFKFIAIILIVMCRSASRSK